MDIVVSDLTLAYDDYVVMHDINFTVHSGDIFTIMGGSGCGKSTLLNTMIGLREPSQGDIRFGEHSFTTAEPDERKRLSRSFGVLFQFGALWSDLTVGENIALPLEELTKLSHAEIRELANIKLALVGLPGAADLYPGELSGGMKKRAGLARAMALEPAVLFLDEPSSGLDPVSARRLDELLLELRDSFGTTFVVVSHDLASIFTTSTNAIFLDARTKTATAQGPPKELLEHPPNPQVEAFLTRSAKEDST